MRASAVVLAPLAAGAAAYPRPRAPSASPTASPSSAALDKVTARTSKFEVPLNETVQFGALKVTPRVCYSRPPTEQPKTTSFVEVDEIELDGQEKRIFTGWMVAESPGLNAVEHPVFDVWLTDCEKPTGSMAQQQGDKPAAEVPRSSRSCRSSPRAAACAASGHRRLPSDCHVAKDAATVAAM